MISARVVIAAAVLLVNSLARADAPAQLEACTIKPVKLSKDDLAGAVFNRKDAKGSLDNGTAMTDMVDYTSADSAYQTGVFRSGASHEVIKGPEGLGYTEFLLFLAGGVTLTSSDGSVMKVGVGEAVTLPKGWTGRFDTEGYTKLYVTYSPDAAKK